MIEPVVTGRTVPERTVVEPVGIEQAEAADLDAILALEHAGLDPASRWSAESWAAELAGADRCVLVAGRWLSSLQPGRPPSRRARPTASGLAGVATFQLVGDTADLHRVVVAPDDRGRGVGRALIEAGLAWAADRRAQRMLLEVEHDNAPALALYGRLGFVELARRTDYYGAGRHALVMQRDIAERGAAERNIAGLEELIG